jgi:hypothetical protein
MARLHRLSLRAVGIGGGQVILSARLRTGPAREAARERRGTAIDSTKRLLGKDPEHTLESVPPFGNSETRSSLCQFGR